MTWSFLVLMNDLNVLYLFHKWYEWLWLEWMYDDFMNDWIKVWMKESIYVKIKQQFYQESCMFLLSGNHDS